MTQVLRSAQAARAAQPQRPCRCGRRRTGARGQALTEFLVISLVLLPLFLLIPVIGKYQDINHATQLASRYAAFDAVLRNGSHNQWKDVDVLAAEVRQRFFGKPDAAIVTGMKDKPAIREGWNDPYAHPLIAAASSVSLSFGAKHGKTHDDAHDGAHSGDASLFWLAPAAGLSSRGLYRANVGVALVNLPAGLRSIEPFDQINLRIERHATVLPDPWTANSPEQTEMRASKLAPINALMPEELISLAIQVVDMTSVKPPAFGKLERWRDVVPADRLRSGEQR
jgi:hypothetical protein